MYVSLLVVSALLQYINERSKPKKQASEFLYKLLFGSKDNFEIQNVFTKYQESCFVFVLIYIYSPNIFPTIILLAGFHQLCETDFGLM